MTGNGASKIFFLASQVPSSLESQDIQNLLQTYLTDLIIYLNLEEPVPVDTRLPPQNTIHVNHLDYKKRRQKSEADILKEQD